MAQCCGTLKNERSKEMSDSYPEYLNPFAEDFKARNKLSISHSFKELKRTLRKSFRIKKKKNEEEPVIFRQKTDTIRNPIVSYPNYQRTTALPRSRFHERLRHEPSTSSSGINPFEEEENVESKDIKKLQLRRKTKKKAPLPPKSLSSQNINESNSESRASHWSLTSDDTNYCDSINDIEGDEDNEAVLANIINFNKEMEKLNDDSNNNIITAKEDNDKISERDDSEPQPNNFHVDDKDGTNLEVDKEENCQHLSQDSYENNISKTENIEEKAIEPDITSDVTDEYNMNNKNNNSDTEVKGPFLYNEKETLYIDDSGDEQTGTDTYVNRISLEISEKSNDFDISNNNEVCDEDKSNANEDNEETPVPKQRKNKLSKSALLGV